jgi:hypothetical protein
MALTRVLLQGLADQWVADAKLLYDQGRFGSSYYLAGYAVEFGLKACIAGLFKNEEFPEREFSKDVYIHKLEKLVALAGLKARHTADVASDPVLFANWGVVQNWTEESRYQNKGQQDAKDLYEAITHQPSGVLPWIKRYW